MTPGGVGQYPTGGVFGVRVKTMPQAEMTFTAFCREASLDAADPNPTGSNGPPPGLASGLTNLS